MAITNHERIGKCLEQLTTGLRPFVERELKSNYQDEWFAETRRTLSATQVDFLGTPEEPQWDIASLFATLWNQWNDVFKKVLGHTERSLVSELRDVRNKWAHQRTFSTDDAYRALDSMERLLNAVSAPKEAEEIGRHKAELLRVKFDEQARHEKRKAVGLKTEENPVAGLPPWREVVTPHRDVASGQYQQAEFAADLWQVYKKRGSDEYLNPIEFFKRTYLTAGLKDLLKRALLRLAGDGGDPVVELQTNFGGGKTHSMLALFHLFSGARAEDLAGMEPVFTEANVELPKIVKRVVIVGNKISPGQPERKDDGTVVRTLWGELAWQLGGKDGYSMLKQADETATNPGDVLGRLLNKYSPCLILIDEWVAYARQLHEAKDLPGGDFETHFTFAQTLSEEIKTAKHAMLVLSIPASSDASGVSPSAHIHDEEVGGARGRQALAALKNAIGRVETSWRPANAEESFKIVRRRLFEPITEPQKFTARDLVAKTFCDLYRGQHQEFPPECKEGDYERKLKAAYPIHPEIFERLYQDWSGLVKFQRTRGVLRLMAAVIHCLWDRQDKSALILPANIPVDEPRVESELTRYLPDGWETVIEKDIDGPDSLPKKIDGEKQNLGRYAACRRVARTLFLASAATAGAANRGVEDRRIKLGCVQPGEAPAFFGDALRYLAQSATYLYQDGGRYWYSTQPTVTKLAEDRAEQLRRDPDKVADEIKKRVREDVRNRGDFAKVHPFPSSSADVPDEMETRLVVMGPESLVDPPRIQRQALEFDNILRQRGNSPRLYKNTLVFLLPSEPRWNELDQATRQFLAWESIENDKEALNLDNFQSRQAATQRKNWDIAVTSRIVETFQWLFIPTQPTFQGVVDWQPVRLSGEGPLVVRASRKLRSDSQMVSQYAPTLLRGDMDKVPLWRGHHVAVKQLIEDYAQYIYLQRVRSPQIILTAIQEGLDDVTWFHDTFAYADSRDEAKQRFVGLRAGKTVNITSDCTGLLVRPDVALAQLQVEMAVPGSGANPPEASPGIAPELAAMEGQPSQAVASAKLKRFHASVHLDASRIGRDAGKIAEEIVQHIALLPDAQVEVVLEIQAEMPNGATESVVRTVTENCRTLRFDSQGFEKE